MQDDWLDDAHTKPVSHVVPPVQGWPWPPVGRQQSNSPEGQSEPKLCWHVSVPLQRFPARQGSFRSPVCRQQDDVPDSMHSEGLLTQLRLPSHWGLPDPQGSLAPPVCTQHWPDAFMHVLEGRHASAASSQVFSVGVQASFCPPVGKQHLVWPDGQTSGDEGTRHLRLASAQELPAPHAGAAAQQWVRP